MQGSESSNAEFILCPTPSQATLGGVLPVARISHKAEVPSTLTLRVEVKEPTDNIKHSCSGHRPGI